MRVKLIFTVRSKIKAEGLRADPLLFERNGARVRLQPPINKSTAYLATNEMQRALTGELMREVGWAASLGMSLVEIQLEDDRLIPDDQVFPTYQPVAAKILSEFIGWLRVLTRQYWVGYKDFDFITTHCTVDVVEQGKARNITVGASGKGFGYGKALDDQTWSAIGARLAAGDRPPSSQLFFCDALLNIAEGDIAQAVVAMGAACDLEVNLLLDDILARREPEFQRIFGKYVKYKFGEGVKLIKEFGGQVFSDADREAEKLVNTLYEMRGKAIHRAQCTFKEDGKDVEADSSNIYRFIDATEKFFLWAEGQRLRRL
ncbi:MAG: hypothetical protein ACYDA9_01110 [Terriglobia bacterium]